MSNDIQNIDINIDDFAWNDEAAQAELEAAERAGKRQRYEFQEGDNQMRILPRRGASPFFVLANHWYTGADGQRGAVVCSQWMQKLPCPVCIYGAQLEKSSLQADRDAAWDLQPAIRARFAAVISGREEEGPVLVEVPARGSAKRPSVYQKILEMNKRWGNFADIKLGYDINIIRRGTGKQTTYDVQPTRRQYALPDLTLLQMLPDLERFSALPTAEEMGNALDALGIEGPGGVQVLGPPTARPALPSAGPPRAKPQQTIDARPLKPRTIADDFDPSTPETDGDNMPF